MKIDLAAITDPERKPDTDDGYGDWPTDTPTKVQSAVLAKLDLPRDLVALVYRCGCGSKSTFGRDYMVNVGALPEKCPECDQALDQSKAQVVLGD